MGSPKRTAHGGDKRRSVPNRNNRDRLDTISLSAELNRKTLSVVDSH